MEPRSPKSALGLYKETRIDLDPIDSNSVVHIQLPSTGAFARNTRPQRRILNTLPFSKTEEDFRRQHIASSSSLYFRKSHKYPRSYLWRCLEGNTTLELRSGDLSKGEHEKREASLILRIVFPSVIRHGGVALADSMDQDVLNVFVLTKNNEIYTLSLRPDFFCRPEASADDLERWCKIFKPSSFSISTPHRLIACTSLELLVSLSDGRLMRLSRRAGEDGSTWQEAAYNDGQWGASLRGLIRWQGNTTVRHDGQVLDQNTVVSAFPSPDQRHILAVCLNHTLKAWNLETGKTTFSKDLLDRRREPQEIPRIMLDPGISTVIQVFEAHSSLRGDQYYIATFSPQQSGVLKFWGVRDADHAENGVRDLFPDNVLKVPDPDDGALWTMADFRITSARDSSDIDIWVLLRLNRRYRLYHKVTNMEQLPSTWEWGWSIAVIGSAVPEYSVEPPAKISDVDPEDSTEKWLDFIFCPGRVPEVVIEAGLAIHNSTQDLSSERVSKGSLKERVAHSVGSHVLLDVSNTDIGIYREHTHLEWMNFWSLVCDLDQSRWEPLSLALDEFAGMPWLTFGDGCSAVRACGEIEKVAFNTEEDLRIHFRMTHERTIESEDEIFPTHLHDLAILVGAATQFRASFSESLQLQCRDTVQQNLWQDSLHSVPVQMQSFYDSCNFVEEISDKQYNDVAAALKPSGGFDTFDTYFLRSLFKKFLQPMSTEVSGLLSTKFGLRLLVKGAQEMITLHKRILTDILLLVVFVDVEVDREEHEMENFEAARVYTEVLSLLSEYQILEWLATNRRPDPHEKAESRPISNITPQHTPGRLTTVLENLFAVDTRPQSYTTRSQSASVTGNIEDLLKWVTGGNDPTVTKERVLVNIQCNLLKNNNIDLASSFLLFQPSTAWATYFRARLHLLRDEFTEAAIFFKKAAYSLCKRLFSSNSHINHTNSLSHAARPNPTIDYPLASSNLLSPLSAFFLSSGPANYYTHILSLFEPARAHSHIQAFARLALQFSPPPDQASDLLARLFASSLALANYDAAYSALVRYSDRALQHNALRSLIDEMAAHGYVDDLLALPFTSLKVEVDTILAEHARRELLTPSENDTPYYKILYAWRLRYGDFRGAAAVLVERLESREGQRDRQGAGNMGGEVLAEYLLAINALGMAGEEEGWVLVGGDGEQGRGKVTAGESGKRKVLRLQDVRRGYQAELDRRSVLDSGRWGIVGGEEEDDEGMDWS
ncbi:hypothetical protein MMC18_001452 [Xylographa bjoerkii]|nr:hypothetical protein [Xylographa bjoerkii]